MHIDDLVPVKAYKFRQENDPWAGRVIDYVRMYIHKETGEYYGRPVTDAGGWIQGTRPTTWRGEHTVYDLSYHQDNTTSRPNREMEFVKFKLEKVSGVALFIECDYLTESPLIFYDPDFAPKRAEVYNKKYDKGGQ